MEFQFINEPRLDFGEGQHICPRRGITSYGVYDKHMQSRRSQIMLGAVGTSACLEAFSNWIDICKQPIAAAEKKRQPNLFPEFCGFNKEQGFYSEMIFNSELGRQIRNTDLDDVLAIKNRDDRIEKAVELYYQEIKFLAQNRAVDVIVCVMPTKLFEVISKDSPNTEDKLDESISIPKEMNFRRALKAQSMLLGKPIQLMRIESLLSGSKGQQDDATKAWNFSTAIYYKAGATNPWRLSEAPGKPQSCALGIAFYRSRDKTSLNTSLAQIFDELGNGLILRGTPIQMDKNDRVPKLTTEQAYQLFTQALEEYRVALKNYPARVVVHKTSNFNDQEIEGIRQAANDLRINTVDFVTVMDSKLRLFRNGGYPPYRGSMISLDEKRHMLYTRGSVWFYQTYPGLYIPQPLELRIIKSEESPAFLGTEILGLTKMNWNNTQLDGKYPVTLGCARKVGEILKYLDEGDKPQIRYGFYM